MDKLTSIKIKYDDGTYSDEIPVSVLAENVQWDNAHTLVDILGSVNVDNTGTIQNQITQLFNEKVSDSELNDYIANQLNADVTNWLNTNVNPVGSAVIVDKTLTIDGAAADAKITGDTITNTKDTLQTEINKLNQDLSNTNNKLTRQIQINKSQDLEIEKLKAAAEGNLYIFKTDSGEAYEKAVPADVMQYATVDKIGGKTLVWNQYIHTVTSNNFRPYNADNIKVTFSNEQADIEYLSSGYGYGYSLKYDLPNSNWVNGHIYYIAYFANPSANSNLNLEIFGNSWDTVPIACRANVWTVCDWIVLNSDTKANRLVYFVRNDKTTIQSTGYKVKFKNPMIIDLTAMFGAGNEPATPEEFRAMFPAEYYPYSEPTLMSFSSLAVVSSGGQVLDTSAIVQKYFPDGMKSAGNVHDEIDWERMVAIQRVGSIDLGTLKWLSEFGNNVGLIQAMPTPNPVITTMVFSNTNGMSARFQFDGIKGYNKVNDKTIVFSNSEEAPFLRLRDDAYYDDISGLLASLNGVLFYYELATPIETPITEFFEETIEVESGGALTFKNDHGDDYQVPVPNQETFMIKLPNGGTAT